MGVLFRNTMGIAVPNSELTEEVKKAFYEECQGITSVAVNLFILVQERVLFDEANEDEKITPRVLKKTAREDMQIIQPMLDAIRKNDLRAMYKYEDIMINLDELMQNHKQNTEYEGRIKEAMKERQNTMQYRRQDMIESLSIEVASIGIFDTISPSEIHKVVEKIVKGSAIDTDYNVLKLQVIQALMELNQKTKEQQEKPAPSKLILPLLEIRKRALKQRKHSYELLLAQGYIKNTLHEFY